MIIYRLITTTFLIIISLTCSFAQDVLFNSQTDVDNFDSNITTISGDLYIDGSSIVNLSNLINLTSIGGNLYIRNNMSTFNGLKYLDGLDNLNSIGGNLNIRNNKFLRNLDGLANLTSIGGHLNIIDNKIYNLDGLINLSSIPKNLTIEENNYLTDISGLANLSYISDNLVIKSNHNLIDLIGLDNITSLNGDLIVRQNSNLITLDGLNNLALVNGNVEISYNYDLALSNGLHNLAIIGGDFEIINNTSLTNLDNFNNLNSVHGNLFIYSSGETFNTNGLAYLNHIGGDLTIRNTKATNFDGLDALTSLGGLLIQDNEQLINLDAFSQITSIDGDLTIRSNSLLTNCCGIQNLLATTGAVTGTTSILYNPSSCSNQSEILSSVCHDSYVDQTATGNNDGSSWQNAYTDLQDALALNVTGIIHIAQGIYKPTPTSQKGISFEFSNNTILLGGYPSGGGNRDPESNITILSGDIDNANGLNGNSYHVVKIIDALNITLDGIHIKDGNASNTSSFGQSRGGGIYSNNSHIKLVNSVVRRNKAINGGGIFATKESEIILENSEIKLNQAEYGSAIYYSNNNNTKLHLNRTKITDNIASTRCAVEVNSSKYIEIDNSLITNNEAANTNAIFLSAKNRDLFCSIQNSTIIGGSNNKSLITMQIGNNDQLNLTMNNSIVAHQDLVFDKNVKVFNSSHLNFNHNNCYFQGASVIGNGTNTLFSDTTGDLLLNTDYSVNECSPVVNMGDNNLVMSSTDVNGNPRTFDTTVDIGAYENQAICSPTPREFNNVNNNIFEEINIYPNPAKNELNIETELENISVAIYDILGRNMIQSNSKKTIDIHLLNKGIYLLYIYKNEKFATVKRFIKK